MTIVVGVDEEKDCTETGCKPTGTEPDINCECDAEDTAWGGIDCCCC